MLSTSEIEYDAVHRATYARLCMYGVGLPLDSNGFE